MVRVEECYASYYNNICELERNEGMGVLILGGSGDAREGKKKGYEKTGCGAKCSFKLRLTTKPDTVECCHLCTNNVAVW